MSILTDFLQSEQVIAFLIAFLIFLMTIFLVVKQWIGFSITLLLLLFSLLAGVVVNNQQDLHHYLTSIPSHSIKEEILTDDFQKRLLQAISDLKNEISVEKENLGHVMDELEDIFQSVETQKQKLQNFIDEVKQHFKNAPPSNLSSEKKEVHAVDPKKSTKTRKKAF